MAPYHLRGLSPNEEMEFSDQKLISSLGSSDYLKYYLLMLSHIPFLLLPIGPILPAEARQIDPPFSSMGTAHQTQDDSHHHHCSYILSTAICQVNFCIHLMYYFNNLGCPLFICEETETNKWLSNLPKVTQHTNASTQI